MVIGVRELNIGSEIAREWASSVKRNPLRKGVIRCVTIAKDDVTKTVGKCDKTSFIEVAKSDGFKKTIVKSGVDNSSLKGFQYPDGSWSVTNYEGTKAIRTNGEFVVKKKDGQVLKIGYGLDGYMPPERPKKFFIDNLDRMGNPKYEVDLRTLFDDPPKSRFAKFLGDVKYKTGKFFERFNKQNTQMRNLAKSIDVNA